MGLAHPPELDDPVPPVAVVEMLERDQSPLLAPRKQHRQAHVLLAGPQLLPHAILHVEPRHGVIAGAIERFAPPLLLDGPESDEPGHAVKEDRLTGLLPGPAEEPPSLAILGRLDGPADLALGHGREAIPQPRRVETERPSNLAVAGPT